MPRHNDLNGITLDVTNNTFVSARITDAIKSENNNDKVIHMSCFVRFIGNGNQKRFEMDVADVAQRQNYMNVGQDWVYFEKSSVLSGDSTHKFVDINTDGPGNGVLEIRDLFFLVDEKLSENELLLISLANL